MKIDHTLGMVFFCALLGLCLAFLMQIASFMQIISKGAYGLRVVRYNACRRWARRGFSVHWRRIEAVLVHSDLIKTLKKGSFIMK